MSIMTSLYSGWSGLRSNSTELAVIGDNIANVNTIGFKGSRAAFQDALAQSMLGSGQVGMGTNLQSVQRIMGQGSLVNTGVATDMALQGDGFFVVKGTQNGVMSTYYTRAGQFTTDDAGYLVNLDGLRVQGFGADGTGNINSTLGDMKLGDLSSPPRATANVTLRGNLDAGATVPVAPWDPLNPSASGATANYNFKHSMTVHDSLGAAHQVDVHFIKTAAGAWSWHATTDGAGVQGGTAGTPTEIASGTLAYDSDGKLTTSTQAVNFNPLGATAPQPINFNFGDPTSTGGTGASGLSQYAGASAVAFNNQDGFASGTLAGLQVDTEGKVVASFSNGESRAVGQVAVAGFEAADQLKREGGNLFSQSRESGQANVGAPGTGGRGGVASGALEQSNVDMGEEFIRMIAAQRAFQANSKTIGTADQLLQELVSLKR